ncbi:DUF4105 domain-containing protein [Pseudomonadota bacterium]
MSVIRFLFILFLYASQVSAQSIELVDYNVRLKALYRGGNNQTQPLNDPYGSFSSKNFTLINKDNILEVFKSIDKCIFPSKAYLLSNLLGIDIDFSSCQKLSKYLEQTINSSILFGYVDPNVKSPMSYFGHGFIVFSNNLSPFSRTISYSAIIPNEISYFELMKKGAIGELEGRFTFNPLHLMFDQYLSVEQRNIYLYDLKFDEFENKLFRLQSYEIFHATFDYHFFTQNCASELLQLISSVKPELLDGMNKRDVIQPSQVVQLLKEYKLIDDVMLTKYSDLDSMFYANNELKNENSGKNKNDIKSFIASKKADLYFKYFKKPLKNHLEYKSQPYLYEPDIKGLKQKPISDISPNKIGIGFNEAHDKNNIIVNYSPGLLKKNESRFSYLNETTLQLLNISIAVTEDDVLLKRLDLLELESLNKITNDVVIPSWRFYIGYNQNYGVFESPKRLVEFSYGYSVGGLNDILSFQPQFSYNLSEDAYALQANVSASVWSDIGNFTVNYIPDLYQSKENKSRRTIFEYKTNFINSSQFNLVLSNHDFFTLGYSYRF